MPISSSHIESIRKDYRKAKLDEDTAGNDPIAFFLRWFSEAEKAGSAEVNAMTLATVDQNGYPRARIVLLKGIDEKGFVFYTNYASSKGKEIENQPHVALVFFWEELERQVRIEGIAEKVDPTQSDAYFKSRPLGSRLGAWSSPQSQIISGRNLLETNYNRYEKEFAGKEIPRPDYWGGYCVVPHRIEFWQGRSDRIHDRIFFELEDGNWKKFRLAP